MHDPDQIAGGNALNVTGMGNKRINSSIGSQWKTRADDVESQVTYIMPFDDIPVFITGMGDIITCNSRGSFTILDYRHQRLEILWTGKEIEWNYFMDEDYNEEYVQWNPYFEAVKKYGEPQYNECFGYEPLLSLGGKESIENLKKMNFEVHITIMGEIQGILSC